MPWETTALAGHFDPVVPRLASAPLTATALEPIASPSDTDAPQHAFDSLNDSLALVHRIWETTMTFARIRNWAWSTALVLLALTAAANSRALNVTWQGTEGGNWATEANWMNPGSGGLPLGDFAEVAVLNNNATAIVNSAITANGPGGIVLGTAAGDIGKLTIQNGGSLTSKIGSSGIETSNGQLNVGLAGKGQLTVRGGGTLSAVQIISAGQISGGTESTITLGDTSGLTANITATAGATLNRTTRVVGPNVNFTSSGPLSLTSTGTLIADIRHATNHSALKSTASAAAGGTLRPLFTGVTPVLGNTWNLLDAKSVVGTFATIDASGAPALGAGQAYQTRVINGGTQGRLMQLVVEQMITLQVNRSTGALTLRNLGPAVAGANVTMDGYTITSTNGGLSAGPTWSSLTDQLVPGWEELPGAPNALSEINSAGSTVMAGGTTRSLGNPYTQVIPPFRQNPDDITFTYTTPDGVRRGLVEYLGPGMVNNLAVIVDPTTGATTLKNDSPYNVAIEGYSIFSTSGALRPANGQWNSLTDQGTPDWSEASPTANVLSEVAVSGSLTLLANTTKSLGTLFNPSGLKDLTFEFLMLGEPDAVPGVVQYASTTFSADFNDSGTVTGADLTVWRNNFGPANANGDSDGDGDTDGRDFLDWQRQLGSGLATAAAGAVPEPSSTALAMCGAAAAAALRRRRRHPGVAPSEGVANNLEPVGVQRRQNGVRQRSFTMHRLAVLALAAVSGLLLLLGQGSDAAAKNIIWVSDGYDTTVGSGTRTDQGFIDMLTAAGHVVDYKPPTSAATAATGYWSTLDAAKIATLNAADLVIVSRAVNSGGYSAAGEAAQWNGLTVPLMLHTPYVSRSSTWGWINSTTIQEPPEPPVATNPFAPLMEPVLPLSTIFTGVTLTDGKLDAMDPASPDNGASFLGLAVDGLGKVGNGTAHAKVDSAQLAGVGPVANAAWVVTWEPGITFYTGSTQIPAGKRMYFVAGEEGETPPAADQVANPGFTGALNLTTAGQQVYLNAVNLMANAPKLAPGDVNGDGFVNSTDLGIIKTNWRTAATTRFTGDLTGDGFVDLADFRQWKFNTVFTSAVPEPSGLALALAGAAMALARRRKRTHAVHSSSQGALDMNAGLGDSQVGTTRRGRQVRPGKAMAFAFLAAAATVAPMASTARALNVAWVSFHNTNGTASTAAAAAPYNFTEAPDIGYTNLLTAAGHTVTRFVTVNDVNTTGLAAQLNAPGIDIVIIGRSVDSAHYQTDAETLVWNTQVTKPMIVMSAFAARGTRLGLTQNVNDTTPDTTGALQLEAMVPSHPIFAGIALDGSNIMVNNYSVDPTSLPQVNGQFHRGLNTVMHPLNGGGQILARIASAGTFQNGLVIGLIGAGATVQNVNTDPDDVLGAPRMVFYSGTREYSGATSQIAGVMDLDTDGQTLFRNAVTFMGGQKLGDVNGNGVVDINDFNVIRDHFQQSVTSRAQGDLNNDGFVDWIDFRQWKSNRTAVTANSGIVPEPGALTLCVVGLAALARAGRRRAAAA